MVRRIDAQVEIANENPAQQLQLLLKPGAKTGEIDAEIVVADRPPTSVHAWLDDTGSDSTGRYRAGIAWEHGDITGASDTLALQASTSPTELSKVLVLSASYRRPFPAGLVVGDTHAAHSDVDAGSSPTAAGISASTAAATWPACVRPDIRCAKATSTSAWAWPWTGANI